MFGRRRPVAGSVQYDSERALLPPVSGSLPEQPAASRSDLRTGTSGETRRTRSAVGNPETMRWDKATALLRARSRPETGIAPGSARWQERRDWARGRRLAEC